MPQEVKRLTQGDRAKTWQAQVGFQSISPDSKSRILSILSHEGPGRYLCKLTSKESEMNQFRFDVESPILTTLGSINPLTIELGYYLLFIISPKVDDTK